MIYSLKLGKDSNTEFHKIFYKKLNNSWDKLKTIYKDFIYNVIYPVKDITGETDFAFQAFQHTVFIYRIVAKL